MTNNLKVVDQQTKILQKFMGSGKGNVLIYNDNRHNIIGGDITSFSWRELLEAALEKVPSPKLVNIEMELLRIADDKYDTRAESGKYLGLKRTTFLEKLKRVDIEEVL